MNSQTICKPVLAQDPPSKNTKLASMACNSDLNADLIMNKVYSEDDFHTDSRKSSPRNKQITKELQTSNFDVLDQSSALDIIRNEKGNSQRGSQMSIKDEALKIKAVYDMSENQESSDNEGLDN